MFSDESHCIYRANPLAEVICQLRFPEILKINTSLPADFQEQIRESFPRYSVRQEAPAPRISGAPGSMTLENQPTTPNYQFLSEDGVWRVNLTDRFISLACTRYLRWEDFAAKLDRPLAAFISLYRPAYFERVGLRYLNFISRQALNLEGVPYARLIAPCYLGILSQDDVPEAAATRSSVDAELAIADGCRVKLHAGPGLVKRGGRPIRTCFSPVKPRSAGRRPSWKRCTGRPFPFFAVPSGSRSMTPCSRNTAPEGVFSDALLLLRI